MKRLNERRICNRTALVTAILAASTVFSFAASPNFTTVVNPIIDLINAIVGPAILVVGAVGSLYCVLLGVKYARAEEPQDREKAKAHLKGAITGFVLIFVLIVGLKLLTPVLTDWASTYQNTVKTSLLNTLC